MSAAYWNAQLSRRTLPRGVVRKPLPVREAARVAGPAEAPAESPRAARGGETRVAEPGSVFANLVSGNVRQRDDAEPSAAAHAVTAPRVLAAEAPPLAELGFGPSMLIRLSQLGVHTTAELARADAVALRTELGAISRLVDVEAWIRHARRTAGMVG